MKKPPSPRRSSRNSAQSAEKSAAPAAPSGSAGAVGPGGAVRKGGHRKRFTGTRLIVRMLAGEEQTLREIAEAQGESLSYTLRVALREFIASRTAAAEAPPAPPAGRKKST